MSSTEQPGHGTSGVPTDEELSLPASESLPRSRQPGDRGGKILAELREFFARRRDRRGIFLPLVGIDRSE